MPVRLYLDVHVDKAIHDQLRLRDVDVLRAQDDSAAEFTDDRLLLRAMELGRLLFTQDVRFKALAEEWKRTGMQFNGLLFGNQLGVTVGALRQRSGADRQGDRARGVDQPGPAFAVASHY